MNLGNLFEFNSSPQIIYPQVYISHMNQSCELQIELQTVKTHIISTMRKVRKNTVITNSTKCNQQFWHILSVNEFF